MKASHGYAVFVLVFAACSGKERPFATEAAPAASEPDPNAVVSTSPPDEQALTPSVETPAQVVGGGESTTPTDRETGVDSSGGTLGTTEGPTCDGGAVDCSFGDAGAPEPPVCVATGPRQCTSDLDNDCNGQVDNIIDDTCRCVPGTTEACDSHPGLDGQGACRPGSRVCILGEMSITSDWGPCEGAVAPLPADSCAVEGDDSDCDGIPSEGCACVDGDTQPCGPATDEGVCQRGISTCVGGSFQGCVGAVAAGPRNCDSPADNDCDGRADNTLDSGCRCIIGTTRACGAHPQDGTGACRAGEQLCNAGPNNSSSTFGDCVGSVGPAQQDSCALAGDDANCNGIENDGCQCVGQDNSRCSGDPNASRCDGQGQCAPCQTNADCSLVSGGRGTCDDGECVSPSEPFECTPGQFPPVLAAAPISLNTNTSEAPTMTGGEIRDGTYLMTEVIAFGATLGSPAPAERFQFSGQFIKHNDTRFNDGEAIDAFEQVGTYTPAGAVFVATFTGCSFGPTGASEVEGTVNETVSYTATANGLEVLRAVSGGVLHLKRFARQ